ncbi:integrase core domain-containing protein [Nonomuraea angiospora]|uniref:integrase core domain-containing protein n=1 Tax=Nonomuraea angiospora TaxID=46172 RepID=UPI0033F1D3AE
MMRSAGALSAPRSGWEVPGAHERGLLTGIRMPRMNAIMERWVQSCRHELLDRCLVWNERHLRHALREYERFYNQHRAHQALNQAAPRRPAPAPITDPLANRRPEHAPTRPARWRPPRVLICGLNCTDGIFGRRRVSAIRPTTLSPTERSRGSNSRTERCCGAHRTE